MRQLCSCSIKIYNNLCLFHLLRLSLNTTICSLYWLACAALVLLCVAFINEETADRGNVAARMMSSPGASSQFACTCSSGMHPALAYYCSTRNSHVHLHLTVPAKPTFWLFKRGHELYWESGDHPMPNTSIPEKIRSRKFEAVLYMLGCSLL